MLVLLPPSETKRDGGVDGTRLDHSLLGFPELRRPRVAAIRAARELSRDLAEAAAALKLGPASSSEARRNRVLTTSPVMPAIDRYDGVLFEGLDAATLPGSARAFAHQHVAIASALLGLTRALDPIPAYRLSHDSRLPGLPLRRHWRDAISAALDAHPGLILDLRSEAYAELGPRPERADSVFVRVVSEDATGRRRALNHFNKKGKGEFTRALMLAGVDFADVDSLLAWARDAGIRLDPGGSAGELELVV